VLNELYLFLSTTISNTLDLLESEGLCDDITPLIPFEETFVAQGRGIPLPAKRIRV